MLMVLNDMTSHGHVPPIDFCEYLMNHGLFDGDVKVSEEGGKQGVSLVVSEGGIE